MDWRCGSVAVKSTLFAWPWIQHQHQPDKPKLKVIVYNCNLSAWETKARVSKVQDHSPIHSVEARMGYKRPLPFFLSEEGPIAQGMISLPVSSFFFRRSIMTLTAWTGGPTLASPPKCSQTFSMSCPTFPSGDTDRDCPLSPYPKQAWQGSLQPTGTAQGPQGAGLCCTQLHWVITL